MFKQLSLYIAFCAVLVHSTVNFPTQWSRWITRLNVNFASRYVLVQSNKEATDRLIAEYSSEVENFVKAMSPEDQEIYVDSLKKYGLI
ncbi:hypothetical protein CAEBREN_02843 [Caenorhabditis brenneri]|uniref:Uncharacterized protein n=1 Tax=Caenorhabditis brenneri TaxID=135651 RepID=G0NMC3_CAEBE|nr:hypothetical protein CAEBREN_02843 [Caenorhabditis brenneri]